MGYSFPWEQPRPLEQLFWLGALFAWLQPACVATCLVAWDSLDLELGLFGKTDLTLTTPFTIIP